MKPHEPAWRRYLRLIRPDALRDIDDELAFHLAMRVSELQASGRAPDEARRIALDRFGNLGDARKECLTVSKRRQRREHRSRLMDEVTQDLRYGFRTLWQHRGFSAAVVATLALGIGATTAMFSAVDAALLRPLPFDRPSELVTLRSIQVPFSPSGTGATSQNDSRPGLTRLQAMPDVFSHVAAYAVGGLNLTGDGDPERVKVGVVTADFFATLAVHPAVGRAFLPEEGRINGPDVAVISDGMWRRRFGAAPIGGRTIRLNSTPYEVVGVMPRGFGFPRQADLWIPLSVPLTFKSFEAFRGWIPTEVVGRLAPGVSAAAAADRLRAAWAQATEEEREGADNAAVTPLRPLQETLVGERRKPLLVLLTATALLLLIASANVMNLLLARTAVRRRELALRAVLGASRGRLLRQLLVESLMLSLAGAVAGLLLAYGSLGTVRLLVPPALDSVAPASLDLRVLAFAIGLAFVTGAAFGLWPAFEAARADGAETVKSGGHGATGAGMGRLRRALVVGELAIALTLLAGSGLMLRSFKAMLDTDLGFRTEQVATVELTLALGTYAAREERLTAVQDVLHRLEGMPGVAAAGAVNDLPLRGGGGISISVTPEGRAPAPPQDMQFSRYLLASEGLFQALGIQLLRGRLMTPADNAAAVHVMVINKTMADRLWPGEDPIGKRIVEMMRAPGGASPPAFRTVIGVVADTRESGAEEDARMQMYFPVYEQPPDNVAFLLRGTLPPAAMLSQLRQAIHDVRPSQAVYSLRMMDAVRASSMAPRRLNTLLISGFGALAVLLASLGVYGVVSYGVTRRGREFGIRAALGANSSDLVRLVTGESAAVATVGVALGLAGAFAFSRALRSLLYGVSSGDGLTFVAAPVLLFALVMVATLVPARTAARTNPVDVIRAD